MPYMYGYVKLDGSSLPEASRAFRSHRHVRQQPGRNAHGRRQHRGTSPAFAKAVQKRGGEIINIDYRLNETVSGHS